MSETKENETKEHYVAYVGTYTNGSSKGIHIYDVDVSQGLMYLRKVVPVNNSSYVCISRNAKYLYSIADEGVKVFEVEADGNLRPINQIDIDGMRGCHLSTDIDGKYLFVAGYHDGKVTVIHTHPDGHLGDLMDGVFHRGQGAINERSYRPHVCCVRVTPDNRFLCAVDEGIDQIVLYKINTATNKLQQIDTLRMGKQAGPNSIHFSRDGKFAYVLCDLTNVVRVYSYSVENDYPVFELIEEQSTLSDERDPHDAAAALRVSYDGNFVFCSTAGDNSVAMFRVDHKTGHLTKEFSLPTAGDYPKDIALFPDQKHIAVVNNGSNSITTFRVDYEKKVLIMKGKPQSLDRPNCIIFQQVEKGPVEFRAISEEAAEEQAITIDKNISPVPIAH